MDKVKVNDGFTRRVLPKAAVLVKDSDSVWEAQQRVEKLRKVEFNWLDQFQVAEDVENFYHA